MWTPGRRFRSNSGGFPPGTSILFFSVASEMLANDECSYGAADLFAAPVIYIVALPDMIIFLPLFGLENKISKQFRLILRASQQKLVKY